MSERPRDSSWEPDEFVDAAAAVLARRSAEKGNGRASTSTQTSSSTFFRSLRLGLASSYYAVSEGSGLPPSDAPLWILGVCYKNSDNGRPGGSQAEESDEVVRVPPAEGRERETTTTSGLDPDVAAAAASDLASIPWLTYRKNIPFPLGESSLTSDVGWGCTLRSGQMLLASAAQRVAVGRHWRRETTAATASRRLPPSLEGALSMFADDPRAPLSLHALLAAPGVAARRRWERKRERRKEGGGDDDDDFERDGTTSGDSESEASSSESEGDEGGGLSSSRSFAGLTAGEWLGPHAFCRAAEAALREAWPPDDGGSSLPPPPMRVLVVGGGGGGAPALDPLAASRTRLPLPRTRRRRKSVDGVDGGEAPAPSSTTPLLVLVPVVAGLGRSINPVYAPQVAAALRWPQSVGAVGGRRGASLYFVGTASLASSASASPSPSEASPREGDEGGSEAGDLDGLLYLDPHAPRPAVPLPPPSPSSSSSSSSAAVDPSDFYSDAPPSRPLPLLSADPSLALGFLCADDEDYEDLLSRAERLSRRWPRWPLVTVLKRGDGGGRAKSRSPPSAASKGGGGEGGEWELL